jgi:hypothetical protein
MSRIANAIVEFRHETRFANSRLAYYQSDLAFAFTRSLPTIDQKLQLLLAPNKWRQSTRRL